MAGKLVNILPMTAYDFSTVGGTQSMPIGQPIDILNYVEAVMIVRVHSIAITSPSSLTFQLFPDAIVDVGSTFLSNIGFPIVAVLNSVTSAPSAKIRGTAIVGQYATLLMKVDQQNPIKATLSVDVCLRNPDDTREATALDLNTLLGQLLMLPGTLRQRAPYLFQQLFAPWGLNLPSVRFAIEPLAPGIYAQALSDRIVGISPQLVVGNDSGQVLASIAHELSHIAQIRGLGWNQAAERATKEMGTHGDMTSRGIPRELAGMSAEAVDPLDRRFTLEAISGFMGEVARKWAPA